jgi:hypothetical protein
MPFRFTISADVPAENVLKHQLLINDKRNAERLFPGLMVFQICSASRFHRCQTLAKWLIGASRLGPHAWLRRVIRGLPAAQSVTGLDALSMPQAVH